MTARPMDLQNGWMHSRNFWTRARLHRYAGCDSAVDHVSAALKPLRAQNEDHTAASASKQPSAEIDAKGYERFVPSGIDGTTMRSARSDTRGAYRAFIGGLSSSPSGCVLGRSTACES